MTDVRESLKIVRHKIEKACVKSKRDPKTVKLIGVTKGIDVNRILLAIEEGLTDIGENYVQEAKKKAEMLKNWNVTWHMIGHIQTNKVKFIPDIFSYVHSVDRVKVLELLNSFGKPLKVLFQVNLSGEETKFGARTEDELFELVKRAKEMENIEPIGLMTMPPYFEDPEMARPYFRRLKEILQRTNERFGLEMKELSMGMSNDFEVAIEEGATMVRIGTAIFGERR
ncbi:MAG: YggS family pyridoxal phosphate-dependent enzyme [Desulfobacterota bacterium]|nr:YggS family pyridoxal phosphate-dependent enzyme [Thermodesulfobacteriota bacterium]MDW8001244.1 YggS family pyridoxal phosphate-dependent enzyme [Deltaproteobacteria bacterium]